VNSLQNSQASAETSLGKPSLSSCNYSVVFRVFHIAIRESLLSLRKLFKSTRTRSRHGGTTLSHPMGEGQGEGVFPFSIPNRPCLILVAPMPRWVFRGSILTKILVPLALIATASTTGCAAHRRGQPLTVLMDAAQDRQAVSRAQLAITSLFPACYRATQRAIVTVGRKQFACDGALTVSPLDGYHLAVVSSLGVVADVRVNSDGACAVLKVTPLFRESWSRQFLARDLRWLFVPPAHPEPAGRLADGRLVLQTRAGSDGVTARYIFTPGGERWQELELVKNRRSFYRAFVRRYRTFAGYPVEVPCEFEVNAASYRVELRLAEFFIPPALQPEARS
jgi:hypothetical protein